jgi:hypothetical protein
MKIKKLGNKIYIFTNKRIHIVNLRYSKKNRTGFIKIKDIPQQAMKTQNRIGSYYNFKLHESIRYE